MGWNGNYVENPEAYAAAIQRRIKANANITRARKLDEATKVDGDDFRAWLGIIAITPELEALRLASQAEYERGQGEGPARRAYDAAWSAWRKRFGTPAEFLREAIRDWGGLTDKQLAFARKQFAEKQERGVTRDAAEAQRRANAQPWTAGRQEVTGVVQSARWADFAVGYGQLTTTLKGLILLADGRKLWTSIPAALQPEHDAVETIKGQTLTFTVTVEPSKDDATVGFGKRPTVKKAATK